VATGDGAPVPNNVMVERVCNATVRQQVYASPRGDFSMQMGSVADSILDASGERPSQRGVAGKASGTGIPRRELATCELRASVSGFHSSVINLMELTGSDSQIIDVGSIVVNRRAKMEGTLSVIPYKAPKDARKAYENGLEAKKNGKLDNARKYFEKAVEVYPGFANAWFQLGTVLQKENQKDAARTAFTQATTIDTKFLPPYLALSYMAFQAEDWPQVLDLTNHIVDLDPMHHVSGYVLDLDPFNYAEAYFFNAYANYKLNRIEDAEKSGLKAERVDLRTGFPQLHLLLAKIFARKNNYARAISEIQTYLELVPQGTNTDQVREWLAKLEKLNGSVSGSE
jgi:hypothetical protein